VLSRPGLKARDRFVVCEGPPNSANGDAWGYLLHIYVHGQNNRHSLIMLNPILLTSGDDSTSGGDLGDYSAELIMLDI
jgi:hypothetical protein